MLTRKQVAGLVALTLMWGLNWPMMKLSLREITPLWFRALTMTGGTLWLWWYYTHKGERMVPTRTELKTVAVLALPNMLGWHLLSILGVQELSSGRAAILGFTMPVWAVLLGRVLFGQPLAPRVLWATLATLVALALLLSHELGTLTGRPWGVVWMELAALSWALGTLMMRRAHLTLSMAAVTVGMMALSSAALWVLALVLEPFPSLDFSAVQWASLAYGVFINYGFAQIIWFGMARNLPPATSAISIMAVPVVGILSATFVVGEWPHWQDALSILFVCGAIAAVLLPARVRV